MQKEDRQYIKNIVTKEIKKITEKEDLDLDYLDSLGWASLIANLESKGLELEITSIIGLTNLDDLIGKIKKK